MNAAKRTLVLGVTGGIAAYKACELISLCKDAGIEVYPIMTDSAREFISELTLRTLCTRPVATDMFTPSTPYEIEHISLAKRAHVLAIVPATANIIGKIANGIADDLLSTVAMATKAPILVAPAMNTAMYESDALQQNLDRLSERGVSIIPPGTGRLACNDYGSGKLAKIETIMSAIEILMDPRCDLSGLRVLVTAGPTREHLDPVRYITNRSSGKMGYALAKAARARGAKVVLITGHTQLTAPYDVETVHVESTRDMLEACLHYFKTSDIALKAAAPVDFTPVKFEPQKIKKQENEGLTVEFSPNKDIVAEMAKEKGHRTLVGFAAETQDLERNALKKLAEKQLDMIVANDVSDVNAGFEVDTNAVDIYFADGSKQILSNAPKLSIANEILDAAVKLHRSKR